MTCKKHLHHNHPNPPNFKIHIMATTPSTKINTMTLITASKADSTLDTTAILQVCTYAQTNSARTYVHQTRGSMTNRLCEVLCTCI